MREKICKSFSRGELENSLDVFLDACKNVRNISAAIIVGNTYVEGEKTPKEDFKLFEHTFRRNRGQNKKLRGRNLSVTNGS